MRKSYDTKIKAKVALEALKGECRPLYLSYLVIGLLGINQIDQGYRSRTGKEFSDF